MGAEPLILAFWVMQAIVAIVLAWRSARDHHWLGAAGVVIGMMVGLSPFFVMQGPAVWGPVTLISVIATATLIIFYAVTVRWKAFSVVMLLLGIPIAYRLFAVAYLPTPLNDHLRFLLVLGEIGFLLGTITCALAFREVLGLLDRFVVYGFRGDVMGKL